MAEKSSLVKIISEKLVKPSFPTPSSSRYYKVNLIDAYLEQSLIKVAMFYPKGSFHLSNPSSRLEEIFEVLETSLSKTLTYYYPFAGRFMDDNITIDCNDSGIQLWHVQIRGSMSEILDNHSDYNPWNSVFVHEKYDSFITHVMIQLSYFECGGICIVVYFSHKVGDGATLANFINDWAIISRGSDDVHIPTPVFLGSSILPPPDGRITTLVHEQISNLVTQRFVFSTSHISELKRNVIAQTKIENPTQVEVVSAFIFERLNLFNSLFKPSSLMQMANLRTIATPLLSEQMVGNFGGTFEIIVTEEKEMKFSTIITELRKSKIKFINTHKACLTGNNLMDQIIKSWSSVDWKKIKDNNFDIYRFSSWLRFPFYEVDFGFGKPIFVCQPGGLIDRTIILMANPNVDGIDAFVTLKRDQMAIFEHDVKLHAFASVNPLICTLK